MRPIWSAGKRPNPIPAWANGPGSWGICKGRAEGPVHSEVGRTFRPPPCGRRFPGALPQALTDPRRWRSDRPFHRAFKMRPGCSAGQRPNPIPAWANGPGACGIFKGRAEGPVHSAVGRTFRTPPCGRRFPGALPQALTGPRRWRSDRNRPALGSSCKRVGLCCAWSAVAGHPSTPVRTPRPRHRRRERDRHPCRPRVRVERAVARRGRSLCPERPAAEVRPRLRGGLEQGHEPRPARPRLDRA